MILPYLVLALLMAALGIFITTRLVVASVRERFLNQLNEASVAAGNGVVGFEAAHVDTLRRMAFTVGVPEAAAARDSTALRDLLLPIFLNDQVELVTVVDTQALELTSFILSEDGTAVAPSAGASLAGEPLIARVLAGEVDAVGDKFSGIRQLGDGAYLVTTAPIRNGDNAIVGALLVGSRMNRLLAEIRTQTGLAAIVTLDATGTQVTASTLGETAEGVNELALPAGAVAELAPSQLRTVTVNLRGYEILYAPLVVRQQTVGVLGVMLSNEYVVAAEVTSRGSFVAIFFALTAVVLVAAFLLYQHIVRPLLRLRAASQAIANGDLEQQTGIRRSDEIGELSEAFDTMTVRLRDRTRENEQLLATTIERNAQLKDINTRLQSAQQQLVQSEKLAAVGQLTAGIVHDVKNPLAVIKGLAEILQEENNIDGFAREQLTNIRDNASRANAIVSDLLTFARQSTPEMYERDLRETIQASLRLTEYLVRKARVRASLELPAEPVMVAYDAQQIEQVLINLIQNASQAMPNGGSLLLRLVREGDQAVITVRDSGVGIPPDNLARIFDPFFTTKGEEGTGLGLSVSYGIITRHHGAIRAESVVGQGTTFIISLPVDQPVEPQAGE